jgi:apolipoprotein N-acyltransferase
MVFADKHQHSLAALLAFASTVLLLWFGNGLNPWWPLLWFAPLPVLLFALRSSWWAAALVAGLSWLTASLNLWNYSRLLGMPFLAWLSIFSVAALVLALSVLLFRALVRRGALWSALLAFPATWVTYEYLRNLLSIHGTATNIAYSQLKFLPFLQVASITGPWGLSFLLFLFPAALATGIHFRKTSPHPGRFIVTGTLSVIALVLIFGAARLTVPESHLEVTVGLITSDQPANDDVESHGANADRLFRRYAMEAEQLASRGARIIVLPEKLAAVLDSENQHADPIFQSVADRTRATIVVGEVHVSPPLMYNQARIYAPETAVLTYDKQHLLPPFESKLTPGTGLLVIQKPAETWGVAICKDMDFTPLSRHYGQHGVGLMLVPAWDFNQDRTWHGHMAIMRGVEDGFSLVRAAKNGFLTVSDDRGARPGRKTQRRCSLCHADGERSCGARRHAVSPAGRLVRLVLHRNAGLCDPAAFSQPDLKHPRLSTRANI